MRSKEREKSNGVREEEASELNCRQGTARTLSKTGQKLIQCRSKCIREKAETECCRFWGHFNGFFFSLLWDRNPSVDFSQGFLIILQGLREK
jgi:hypothetical protein